MCKRDCLRKVYPWLGSFLDLAIRCIVASAVGLLSAAGSSAGTSVAIEAPENGYEIVTTNKSIAQAVAGVPRQTYLRSAPAYLVDSLQYHVYTNETLPGLSYYGITFTDQVTLDDLVDQKEEVIYLGAHLASTPHPVDSDVSILEVNLKPELDDQATDPVFLVLASPNFHADNDHDIEWQIQGYDSVDLKGIYFLGGDSARITMGETSYTVAADGFLHTSEGVLISGLENESSTFYSPFHYGLRCEEIEYYLIGVSSCLTASGERQVLEFLLGIRDTPSNDLYRQTGLYLTSFNAAYLVDSFEVTVGRLSEEYVELRDASEGSVVSASRYMANPANDLGYSFNQLDQLYVDRPLEIINLPTYVEDADGNLIKIQAADRIVIEAKDIKLFDSVRVVGPPTDLILINSVDAENVSNAEIYCEDCRFENIQRLTVAVVDSAAYDISSSEGEIVELKTAESGRIVINNLAAPGALALEILSYDLSLDGLVTLHEKVAQNEDNFDRDDEYGYLSIGSGTANVYVGSLTWDFNSRLLVGTSYIPEVLTLEGNIEALSVKVASARFLILNTNVSTIVDMASTINYRGGLMAVEEGILIETLGVRSPLGLGGIIETDGFLDIRASGSFGTQAEAKLRGSDVTLFSALELTNFGELEAQYLAVGASAFRNEGSLLVENDIEISADYRVLNQYGGFISGRTITIETNSSIPYSFVRNGADRPYYETLRHFDQAVTPASWSGGGDPFRWGRFYDLERRVKVNRVLGTPYAPEAPKTSAHILGENIYIKTSTFENINPYYEILSADVLADFNEDFVEQVVISAQRHLAIDAADEIRNTSALMTVNEDGGLMQLFAADGIYNERYRVQAGLSTVQETIVDGNTTQTIKEASAYLSAVSPPAVLRSLGRLEAKISSAEPESALRNDFSYIEILGDATIDASQMNLIGMTTEFAAGDATTVTTCRHNRLFRYCVPKTSTDSMRLVGYVDSLFYVHGDLKASSSAVEVRNVSVMDQFLQAAVEAIALEDYQMSNPYEENDAVLDLDGEFIDVRHYICNPYGSWTPMHSLPVTDTVTYERTENGSDQVQISIVNHIHKFTNNGTGNSCDDQIGYSTDEENWVMDTVDVLTRLYNMAVDFFESVYNEVNFWS